MKKLTTIVALVALMLPGSVNADNDVKIGKQNIKLESDLMTPEALWPWDESELPRQMPTVARLSIR